MGELISQFGIDWRLLLAQVVNFVILLVVLKKFAYGPIIQMLRKRREVIQKGLADAKAAREKLQSIEVLREEAIREVQTQAFAIVKKAEALGAERKEEIVQQAARKGEVLLAEAKRAAGEEQVKLKEQVLEDAHELVRLGIERVLGKMTRRERDDALIKEALGELRTVTKNS